MLGFNIGCLERGSGLRVIIMLAENFTTQSSIRAAENFTTPYATSAIENYAAPYTTAAVENYAAPYTTAAAEGDQLYPFPVELMQVRASLIGLCMVVGLVGNTLTLAAIVRSPHLHNATTAFIASLGVGDLMFCALVMPAEISLFSEKSWLRGNGALCVFQTFFEYISVAGALFSISLISLNRFVLIVLPNAYPRMYQRHWVAAQIAGIWAFSLIMLAPTLAGSWGRFWYQPGLRSCAPVPVNGRSPNIALFVIAFTITCVVISVCYVAILAVVIRTNRRQQRNFSPSALCQDTEQASRRAQRRRQDEMRVTQMSLAVFVTFVVGFSPLTVANIWDAGYQHPELHVAGYVLVCVSSCANPIIYVTMSRQYRQAYRALFCRVHIRRVSDSSSVVFQVAQPAPVGLRSGTSDRRSAAAVRSLRPQCTSVISSK